MIDRTGHGMAQAQERTKACRIDPAQALSVGAFYRSKAQPGAGSWALGAKAVGSPASVGNCPTSIPPATKVGIGSKCNVERLK
jgi:hypothetical protein